MILVWVASKCLVNESGVGLGWVWGGSGVGLG